MIHILKRVRPNILIGMFLISVLGSLVSWIGWQMDNETVVAAAGVGAIMADSNLCAKILEKE